MTKEMGEKDKQLAQMKKDIQKNEGKVTELEGLI